MKNRLWTICLLAAVSCTDAASGRVATETDTGADGGADACVDCDPRCGDGALDDGEDCDDGDGNSDTEPDACRTNCRLPACGDGTVDDGEVCDDGDQNSDSQPDACRPDCTEPTCGDGVTDEGEHCDGDEGCRDDCTRRGCGDSVLDDGEECDDGVDNSDTEPDACRTNCRSASCGDGVVDDGEECDDAGGNSDETPDACRTTCRAPRCGDGVVDDGEGCDDATENSDLEPDACRLECERAGCGDGVVDEGEDCDDGGANSDDAPDACRTDCRPASCGDGVEDRGELCDDGNDVDSDGCTECRLDACDDDLDCDDNNDCTQDTCEVGQCVNESRPDETACDDGRFCTAQDACLDGECVGSAVDCGSLDSQCQRGVCREEDEGCVAQDLADDTECTDGLTCTQSDACAEGVCEGTDVACDHLDDECMQGVCVEPGGCQTQPREDGTACDDELFCSEIDVCVAGTCVQHEARDVDDAVACTVDSCDEEDGVVHEPSDAACADDTLCNGVETCDPEAGCQPGTQVVCEQPDEPCRVATCDPDTGECVVGPANDGTACDDGLFCTTASECRAGVCTGTQDRVVDDGVPCTDDRCDEDADQVVHAPNDSLCRDDDLCDGDETCDAALGCQDGDAVVCPPSEVACQVSVCQPDSGECVEQDADDETACDDEDGCTAGDRCQSGECVGDDVDCQELDGPCVVGVCRGDGECNAEPVPNGTGCNDDRFCTVGDSCQDGVCEGAPRSCAELDNGCVVGVCEEEEGCIADTLDPGETCDDGIACTRGDRCLVDGRCAGDLVVECVDSSCDDPQPFPDVMNINAATLSVTVTLDGEALPNTNPYSDSAIFYLRARDTGALHDVKHVWYNPNGPHTTDAHSVPPGVYDVIYRRDYNSESNIVDDNRSGDGFPHGYRVLQREVVVGAGHNDLTIDLPVARLTTTITRDGAALPNTNPYSDSAIFYLRAHDTGALHDIKHVWYNPNGPHTTEAHSVVPGRYDVIYRRDYNSESNIVDDNRGGDAFPHGYRVLQRDLDIEQGANDLVIDLPVANVSLAVTLGGQPLPSSNPYSDSAIFYLRAHDTGALHDIKHVWYNPNGPHTTDAASVVPGTYDLIYRRDYNSDSRIVDDNRSGDLFPHGYRVLRRDLELVQGDNPLTVDVPVGTLQVNMTLGGQALPNTNPYSDSAILYLRAQDTGALHDVKHVWYNPNGPHTTDAHSVIPGTYDVLYRRDYSSESRIVDDNRAGDQFPHGYRVLQRDVVIDSGSNVLNVDVPVASLTVNVTLGGAPLPSTNPYSDSAIVYLRAQDTGALHDVKHVWYNPNGPHTTQAASVPAGVYDVLYRRDYNSESRIVDDNRAGDQFPNGYALLQRDVRVTSGANTLSVDIPVRPLATGVTLDGAPLPSTNPYSDSAIFYLERLDTGALHDIKHVWYNPNGPHTTEAVSVPPGTYRLVYRRDYNSESRIADDNRSPDRFPNGYRQLGCFLVE